MKRLILFLLLVSCQGREKKDFGSFRVVHIGGSTFDMPIDILITSDKYKALEYVRLNNDTSAKIEDFDARGVTFTINDGRPPIIWIPQMDFSSEDMSIINHELFHANISILNWAGVYLSDSTEEVYAYNYQFLTKQFYERIK